MKLIIHAGINPGDTNLLKETLRKNRQGLQAEGLCWGAYKHQDKHKILFNIPKVNHNWIERFTRKAKAAVGDHEAAIIFLDAALLFQSRTNPQDIEKILVKLKILFGRLPSKNPLAILTRSSSKTYSIPPYRRHSQQATQKPQESPAKEVSLQSLMGKETPRIYLIT